MSYPFLSRGMWGRPQSRHAKRAPFTANQLFRALGGRRTGPSIGDRIIFDALEPRLLMNADVLGINLATQNDDGLSHDMIVRLVEENQQIDARSVTTQRVEIRDRTGGALLAFGDLAEISAISIQGGGGNDTLTIDAASFGNVTLPAISFDGGAGDDRVVFDATADTTWTVDGDNAGRVGSVTFTNTENLTGAADNRDTFVVTPAGALDGVMDGGVGGFDTMVLEAGYTNATYTPTGPQSGIFNLDGNTFRFDGLEPTVLDAEGGVVTVDLSEITDVQAQMRMTYGMDDGYEGYEYVIEVDGNGPNFEKIYFNAPSSGVVLILGAGNDNFKFLDLGFEREFGISIDGNGGNDSVTVDGHISLADRDVTINAENIQLLGNSSISTRAGDITLNASSSASGSASGTGSVVTGGTAAVASIGIGPGAVVSGRAVTITAQAASTATIGATGSNVDDVGGTFNSSATINVQGNIWATGALKIAANVVTTVDVDMAQAGGFLFIGSDLDDVSVSSTNVATVTIAAVNISGATIELGADTDVEIDITVEDITLQGLSLGTQNVAVAATVANTTSVTIAADAALTQTGSGTVTGTGNGVDVSATDDTDVTIAVSAAATIQLPVVSGVSVLFEALAVDTGVTRNTSVTLGNPDANGTATAPTTPTIVANSGIGLSAASTGDISVDAQTDFVGVATNDATENTQVRAKGVTLKGASVSMEASSATNFTAKGQESVNEIDGKTVASVAYSKVEATGGGITISGSDSSTALAWALPSKFSEDNVKNDQGGVIVPELVLQKGYAANLVNKAVSASADRSDLDAQGEIVISAERSMKLAAIGEAMSLLSSNSFFDSFLVTAAGTWCSTVSRAASLRSFRTRPSTPRLPAASASPPKKTR